jgi:hypothetical protein
VERDDVALDPLAEFCGASAGHALYELAPFDVRYTWGQNRALWVPGQTSSAALSMARVRSEPAMPGMNGFEPRSKIGSSLQAVKYVK